MQATTLECQLAQAQLGKYLSGGKISPEAERQLEAHVSECPICKQEVTLRKQALQAAATGFAVAAVPDTKPVKNPKAVRINLLDAAKEPKSPLTKPIVLSSILVVVLYAMSVFAKDPTRLLGPKLQPTVPSASEPVTIARPDPKPSTPSEPTTVQPRNLPSLGPEKPVAEETPVVKQPEPEPQAPVKVRPTSNARRATAPAAPRGIRVYDSNGQPIGGN